MPCIKVTNVDKESSADRIRAVLDGQSYMNLRVILRPALGATFDVMVETDLPGTSEAELTQMVLGILCHALPKPPLSPVLLLSPSEIEDMKILAQGRSRVTKLFRAYLLLLDR
jgi:hypothetical protein